MSEECLYKIESGIEIPPKLLSNKKIDWTSIANRMKHMECVSNLSWNESQGLARAIKSKYLTSKKRQQGKFKYRVWKIKIGEPMKIIL